MESYVLSANVRSAMGKQAKGLRRLNRVPGVVYGHGVTSVALDLESIQLQKVFRQAGSSSLVDLVVGDAAPIKVLIHDIQRHPTKPIITHVDFYQVKMTEKLETEIELELVGESPAVKEQGGILIRTLDKVKVQCLPGDLVPHIQVDISVLGTFDARIHVSDIKAPKGITILDGADEVVASVTAPRSEAELESLSEVVTEDVTKVESAEKKEVEEEVPADDAAAPAA